jgi:hypothetical protein
MLFKRISIVGVALIASVVVAAFASAASANEFSVFAQCPKSNPNTVLCLHSETVSGEVKAGNTAVPIVHTITLQGGLPGNFLESTVSLIPAANGETLSKTPQPVPGGLLGLVRCNEIKGEGFLEKLERGTCEAIFENKTTGVTATTELVGSVEVNFGGFLGGAGTALALPVRVKLDNPLLGSSCFVGSSSNPVKLALTTGTTSPPPPNKPIKGNPGTLSENTAGTILFDNGFTLVDNSFAAPKAEGCGGLFSFLINPIVNGKLGLPSAAGNNAAILNGSQQLALAENVK